MFRLMSKQKELVAGQPVSLKIRYIHKGKSLKPGAALRIGYNVNDGAGIAQIENPHDWNYLLVQTPSNAKLKTGEPRRRRSITFFPGTGVGDLCIFEIRVVSGLLQPGDIIDIFLGVNNTCEGGFIPGKCCASPLELFYHIDPDNRYPLKTHHPGVPTYQEYMTRDGSKFPDWKSCGIRVKLVPAAPALADISLPGIIQRGQECFTRITLYDNFYNAIPEFNGNLHLLSKNISGINSGINSISTGNDGSALIPLRFDFELPVTYLSFEIENLGKYSSNPFKVLQKPGQYIFWGDLHGHSNLSDGGRRGADYFFNYARNVRGLDFAALADHSFGLAVKGHWKKLKKAIKEHSEDERFIPVPGYEIMTNGQGHRNIYFPDLKDNLLLADYQPGAGGTFVGENIPAYRQIWDSAVPKAPEISDIMEKLKDQEFLWTAHHCGKLTEEDKKHLVLYEACSEWGISAECFKRNFSTKLLQDVFASGFSPGLMGGSDDHTARAGFKGLQIYQGGSVRYPSGLTGVFSPSLTLNSIYNNLSRKQCYATTGIRFLVEPRVKRRNTKIEIDLHIAGKNLLDRAWVFKNGKPVCNKNFEKGKTEHFFWEDTSFAEKDTCFIQISQADGEIAWINPLPFTEIAK